MVSILSDLIHEIICLHLAFELKKRESSQYQLIKLRRLMNETNVVRLTDTELKFDVVVAESRSQKLRM